MLRISCPWCGARDEIEFSCGGEAHIVTPSQPESLTADAWADYLYMRANPKGWYRERWVHTFGCRRWFNVLRDTTTERIHAVYRVGDAPPDLPHG